VEPEVLGSRPRGGTISLNIMKNFMMLTHG